jgi:cysteinyl-tRNA synthetase
MTDIHLYNTRTRTKELFKPLREGDVRMYVCGPTVYDRAHIGNARPVVVFDVLYRLLHHVYGDGAVTYARNFTDVDDRIIKRAVETKGADETLEAACRRITDETIGWYHEDMDALGALRPSVEPRCTEFVPQMVAMTEKLIAEGHAYVAEGHVLFDVATFKGYGKLSRRSLDDMVAGSRVEVAPYKRSPMDFVIWKPSTPEQPGWPSPWGRGRPGWHIECSAMAQALLGDTFDIHGGGIDLVFPHHENEVAQSCCANHTDRMANVWMHNGFLQVEGEKMAKSAGNFFTVKDLLEKGMLGEVVRVALMMTHYRQPLDWNFKRRFDAEQTIKYWVDRFARYSPEDVSGFEPDDVSLKVVEALADDLNTPEAIAEVTRIAKSARTNDPSIGRELAASASLLGFELSALPGYDEARARHQAHHGEILAVVENALAETRINELLKLRVDARKAKDFKKADAIRDGLIAAGLELRDGPEGTTFSLSPNFDPQKLEALK